MLQNRLWAVLLLIAVITPTANAQNAKAEGKAIIKVQMPIAKNYNGSAPSLKVNGKETTQTDIIRIIEATPLEPGKVYEYDFVSMHEPNNYTKITRRKTVKIRAGDTIEVDMTKVDNPKDEDVLVRYVPTPNEIVDEMLKLAEVGKGDVIYDLGCGDGRIVCRGVAKAGASRGVGVDIDPERIEDCKRTAKEYNVEGKVQFLQQDVLKLEKIGDATKVLLYMGNDLNLRLRPILWKELKPGTVIVSHRFTMGDWPPEKTITVTDNQGEEYKLHKWTITGKEGKPK